VLSGCPSGRRFVDAPGVRAQVLNRSTSPMKKSRTTVPCNGCTLCCRGDAIRLFAEDRASEYETVPHPFIPGALMIAHQDNGNCIYLVDSGCSIHDRAPSLCRTADCRSLALGVDYETAKALHRMGRIDFRVWLQGHRLLERKAGCLPTAGEDSLGDRGPLPHHNPPHTEREGTARRHASQRR
jgi:uncharacterized protein